MASDDDTLATMHDDGAPLGSEPEMLPRLGRYVLLDRLGAGAMGTVFLAHDPELDRKVAIKLLRGGASEVVQARLLREAQAMARLSHRNVAAVYDVGWFNAEVFMAMEYVAGGNLQDWLASGDRSWEEVLPVFIAAGRGLEAAHAVGLIHRDFKPANVLLGLDAEPKVTDFGLVRSSVGSQTAEVVNLAELLDADLGGEGPESGSGSRSGLGSDLVSAASSASGSASASGSGSGSRSGLVSGSGSSFAAGMRVSSTGSSLSALDMQLTRVGSSVGTPAYMAPEQFGGKSVDARSDQFAFCVALHEALWGVSPYGGKGLEQRLRNILAGQREPRPRDREVPDWLAAAVERGLQVKPDERWPSMTELLAALSDDPRQRRRTRRRWALGLGLGFAVVAGIWGQQRATTARCEAASAAAAEVWASHAAGLSAAIEAGGPTYAAANTERIAAGVEDWVARWGDARATTCAGSSDALAPLDRARTERCLSQQLDALSSLFAVIEEESGTAGIAAHAITAVAALPDPSACQDPRYAEADVSIGGCAPELNLRLHRLRALELAGLYAEGVEAGEALLAAEGLGGCAALEAQVLLTTARLDLKLGQRSRDQVIARLRQALTQANSREDLATARSAALALADVERRRTRFDAAEVWLEVAELYAERLGVGPAEVVEQELVRAQLQDEAGRYADSHAALERARELVVDTLGEDHPLYLDYLTLAAGLDSTIPDRAHNRALLEPALDMATRLYGPAHPETIDVLLTLAPLLAEPEARMAMALDAQAKAEAAHGPNHRQSILAADRVGVVMVHNNETEAAAAHYPGVIARYEQLAFPAPILLAHALMNYGVVLRRLRRLAEAEPVLRRALTLLEGEYGPEHYEAAQVMLNLANVVDELGRVSEAVSLQRQALVLVERRETNTTTVALLLDNMGMLELELGQSAAALRDIERAAQIGRALLDEHDLRNIDYLTDLGLAEVANGQIERARGHFDELMDGCERHPDPHNIECVYSRGIVAEFLLEHPSGESGGSGESGDFERARELSEAAIAHLDALRSPTDIGQLRFIHARILDRAGERAAAEALAAELLVELAKYPEQRRARDLIADIRAWRAAGSSR